VKKRVGKEPAVFLGEDFTCFQSRFELREKVKKLAQADGCEPFWIYEFLHDSLIRPRWLTRYPIDFETDKWDCCLFVPLEKEYGWMDVPKFLMEHFKKFGSNEKFNIEELAKMIHATYPKKCKNDCKEDGLSIIEEFSQERGSIAFANMLECYRVTWHAHPKAIRVELSKMGFKPPLSTTKFSNEMLDLLEETYLLIKQVKNCGLQENGENQVSHTHL